MAVEKIDYDVAPEELVIEETQEQLKSVKEQIMDGLSLEQQSKATPSAIVQDRESQQQNLAVEGLSDKEKLTKVQTYFKDMNKLLSPFGSKTINYGGYKLSLNNTRGDAGYSTEATLRKGDKELFVFDLSANMFHKERGDDYPINGAMTVGKETLFYHGDDKYNHGIYDNYGVLDKASSYTAIIKNIVQNQKK